MNSTTETGWLRAEFISVEEAARRLGLDPDTMLVNRERKSMINPTVGRIVWFYSDSGADPLAAIVTMVWDARLVNLCVFDRAGLPFPQAEVVMMQPEDEVPPGPYCCWMPYQVKKQSGSESGEKEAGTQSI